MFLPADYRLHFKPSGSRNRSIKLNEILFDVIHDPPLVTVTKIAFFEKFNRREKMRYVFIRMVIFTTVLLTFSFILVTG